MTQRWTGPYPVTITERHSEFHDNKVFEDLVILLKHEFPLLNLYWMTLIKLYLFMLLLQYLKILWNFFQCFPLLSSSLSSQCESELYLIAIFVTLSLFEFQLLVFENQSWENILKYQSITSFYLIVTCLLFRTMLRALNSLNQKKGNTATEAGLDMHQLILFFTSIHLIKYLLL